MNKIEIGMRFGRLTIMSRAANSASGAVRWNTQCDCGGASVSSHSNLVRGSSRSCGCLMREMVGARARRHGRATGVRKTPEYNAWQAMLQRCRNPNHKAFKNYGGRGILVCEEWSSFEAFFAHIGERPSPDHSLDRINNDGNYEPGNVRWTTRDVQIKNQRPRPRDAEGKFA